MAGYIFEISYDFLSERDFLGWIFQMTHPGDIEKRRASFFGRPRSFKQVPLARHRKHFVFRPDEL